MDQRVVIDASVAAKWILREVGSDAAVQVLQRDGISLHAPELCVAELTNVLWKRVARGELTQSEALDAVELIADLPVRCHAHQPLAPAALMIALAFKITAYDALYVALAQSLGGQVITADRRLVEAGASDPDWPVIEL